MVSPGRMTTMLGLRKNSKQSAIVDGVLFTALIKQRARRARRRRGCCRKSTTRGLLRISSSTQRASTAHCAAARKQGGSRVASHGGDAPGRLLQRAMGEVCASEERRVELLHPWTGSRLRCVEEEIGRALVLEEWSCGIAPWTWTSPRSAQGAPARRGEREEGAIHGSAASMQRGANPHACCRGENRGEDGWGNGGQGSSQPWKKKAQGAWNGCAGEGSCPWEGAASMEEWSSAAMEFLPLRTYRKQGEGAAV